MKLKKIVALCMAAAMTVSLAACGSTEAEKETSAGSVEKTSEQANASESAESSETAEENKEITFPLEETMEFTGFSIMANSYYYADNTAWKAAMERANIHIELTEAMRNEVTEKGNMLMAGGDYPDMLFKASALSLDTYGMEGLLIPLEDLIREYAPNLTAILDERSAWDDISAPDGHIYSLPSVNMSFMQDYESDALWLNKRWLDNLGLEEPTNAEELYNVLKAFKEQDANGNGDPNDEIPLTFVSKFNIFLAFLDDGLFYPDKYCAVIDDELVFYPLTEGYKENYLAYFAKMYEEGILDPNCFTQTQEQLNALGPSGDIYGMYKRSTTSLVPEENRYDYVTLKPFNENGLPLNSGVTKGGLAITDACENPEVLVAWADYFYSEEGGRLAYMGIEGDNYTVNADGTFSKIDNPKYENATYQCTLLGLAALPAKAPELSFKVDAEADPYTAYVYEERDALFGKGVIMPVLTFTEEENETLSTLRADIVTYIENYSAEVISGQKSLEETWDEFQETLKKMGAEELQSMYQTAYERGSAQ